METTGKITGLIANLITILPDGPVRQNEICYVELTDSRLMAEVIKVDGQWVHAQVYDSTRGVRIGDQVSFTGGLLEISLGPGLLSKKFDGLENDLDKMEGLFLEKGAKSEALDEKSAWYFNPLISEGVLVEAGSWLGEVPEQQLMNKIMVPFHLSGSYKLKWIAPAGAYKLNETIAILSSTDGEEVFVSMVQKWPVRIPIKAYAKKVRPYKMMVTGIRTIDALNPILEGGTGFIPGPFGCGKTVLQQSIAKQANADIVVVAACGERANEVVEIFTEFPTLTDPTTGRMLMERTILIANTSSMPVAAREASVYTAMTISEYYRNMGFRVLLLADSTSRWAQALREMSNRMEELPGPDAFPMDLTATIAGFYARAGEVLLNNNDEGAITFIGTVSPAGGNLKEPVTEATKKAARCFFALSQRRADSKRYPAIDPQMSYSKYIDYPEFGHYMTTSISSDWITNAKRIKALLQTGKETADQINILGDDGVGVDDHVKFWKSELLDFVLLQQDAFDKVDMNTSVDRQLFMTRLLLDMTDKDFYFNNFQEVRPYFSRLIFSLKQMNYAEFQSDQFKTMHTEVLTLIREQLVSQNE